MNISDGRTIILHNGRVEDTRRLVDAIADKLVLELFALDGRLFWLSDANQLTPMNRRLLGDLIARHFVTVRLASGANGPHPEFLSLEIDGQSLIDVMDALASRVAKGPSQPRVLSEQKKQEIRYRLKVGEPRESLAKAYDISLADIKAAMAAA
jgi:hypothetical protein